ncbi:Uncharacterized protein DBV15_07253 [Temnothorax longispinosus]|uniref:Uncharacterized protein n=1 Tax=Temnothorax longispinosus TaxID=300112 RepID=A0A4S2JJU8_9HYME|nr:Uncharacterized protein DBV15_07253 [Temnothorax longispinosus]
MEYSPRRRPSEDYRSSSRSAYYQNLISGLAELRERSNTFVTDLRISVTGAVVRDNSIKVMPDMAKGER